MDRITAVVAIVASLATGFLAGWALQRPAAERVASLERENERLQTEVAAVSARLLERPQLAGTPRPAAAEPRPSASLPDVAVPREPGAAPTAPARPADEPAAAGKGAPRFALAGYEAALAETDWPAVGESVRQMVPLLAPFAEEWAKTGKIPVSIGRIQQLNGPLLESAMRTGQRMGLENPNEAFTHPVFQVNLIAAGLQAAGVPLSDDQAATIQRTAESYVDRDRARLAGYGPDAFALQKLLDESVLRDEFFTQAFAPLTAEQRQALQPASTRGRLGIDLFSYALLWQSRTQVLPFRDREGLAADMERQASKAMVLPDSSQPAVHDAVVEWASGWPREVIDAPADTMSLRGMVFGSAILEAARREIALLRRVIDLGRLDDATAKKVRAIEFVLVPVRSAPAD